jgi:hypothetical protein
VSGEREAFQIGDRVAFFHESAVTGPQITEGVIVAILDEEHVLVQHPRGDVLEYLTSGLTPIPDSAP